MNPLRLADYGSIIPVIVIPTKESALPIAEALLAGGVRVLEITLRSECALSAIEQIAKELPEAIVGAGTVRSPQDLAKAKSAGSQFAVSPGYTSELGSFSRKIGLPLLPGVSTASEIIQANQEGHFFLKLFPAVAVGGINLLKSFSGPFPDVKFCPTGGITLETASQFLALSNVIVCGGTWLTPNSAIENKNWGKITALAKEASEI